MLSSSSYTICLFACKCGHNLHVIICKSDGTNSEGERDAELRGEDNNEEVTPPHSTV